MFFMERDRDRYRKGRSGFVGKSWVFVRLYGVVFIASRF